MFKEDLWDVDFEVNLGNQEEAERVENLLRANGFSVKKGETVLVINGRNVNVHWYTALMELVNLVAATGHSLVIRKHKEV